MNFGIAVGKAGEAGHENVSKKECCPANIIWNARECVHPSDTSCVLPLSAHDVSKEEVRQQLDSIEVTPTSAVTPHTSLMALA